MPLILQMMSATPYDTSPRKESLIKQRGAAAFANTVQSGYTSSTEFLRVRTEAEHITVTLAEAIDPFKSHLEWPAHLRPVILT